jgi:hypothetical protein
MNPGTVGSMEVRFLAEVTSIVRDRGRAFGVLAALAASVALVFSPAASAAVNGDPIASSTFTVKVSGGFKKQLKSNGVKMKPTKLTLRSGDVDPTTGAADLKLNKKITFKLTGKGIKKCTRKADSKKKAKQCKKGVAYSNLKGSLPGNVKGSSGNLFSLGAATVARNGFGADLSGIKVKFLKGAAKKINKKLGLGSLHAGSFGTASLSYQPQTVVVTGGTAVVRVPITYAPSGSEAGTSVTGKLPSHCIDPFVGGVLAIAPGVLEPLPDPNTLANLRFPVTGGTVSPAGNDGVIQMAGGVRLSTGKTIAPEPPSCINAPAGPASHSVLEFTNLAPNLALKNVQANALLGGTSPGCNLTGQPANCPTAAFGGDKGPAIGQVLDVSGLTVSADPSAKTVTIGGALIRNNALSATVLAGLFPNASGDPAQEFADGDKFGIATLNATTR